MEEEQIISPEVGPEHIPTIEEVQAVFKELTEKQYEEERRGEDEKGLLYLLDVRFPGESEGEVIELSYMRAGSYEEGQASETQIHKIYYQNGAPIGGESAAKYVDGKWKIL